MEKYQPSPQWINLFVFVKDPEDKVCSAQVPVSLLHPAFPMLGGGLGKEACVGSTGGPQCGPARGSLASSAGSRYMSSCVL